MLPWLFVVAMDEQQWKDNNNNNNKNDISQREKLSEAFISTCVQIHICSMCRKNDETEGEKKIGDFLLNLFLCSSSVYSRI